MKHPADELREMLKALRKQYMTDLSMSEDERKQFQLWIDEEEAELKRLEALNDGQ